LFVVVIVSALQTKCDKSQELRRFEMAFKFKGKVLELDGIRKSRKLVQLGVRYGGLASQRTAPANAVAHEAA